jgi:hypothetical protein
VGYRADFGNCDTDQNGAGRGGVLDVGFFVEKGRAAIVRLVGMRNVVLGSGVRAAAAAWADDERPVVGVAVGACGEGRRAPTARVEGDV